MNKKIVVAMVAASFSFFSSVSMADLRDDEEYCNKQANSAVQARVATNQQARIINGVVGLAGNMSLVNSIRRYGYGVSNDIRTAEYMRKSEFNRCMMMIKRR